MPATGKISLDASDYKRTLEDVRRQTAAAAGDMSNSIKKFGQDVGNAGNVMKAVSGEIAGSFGAAGKVISSVASGPVALLAAAFGALLAVGKTVWDHLTVSAEEYEAKLHTQIDMEQKRLDKLKETQSEEAAYMERLNELNQQESLSNEEKTEAAYLVELLSKRYKDFGVVIDETTGKMAGLEQAERRMNEAQKAQMMQSIENQLKNKALLSNKDAEDLIYGPWYQEGWDAITWNRNKVHQTKWDYMKMSTPEKLAFAQSRLEGATTDSEISGWGKVAASLQEQIDLENKLNNLRETGKKTEAEHAAELKTTSQQSRKAIEEETKAVERYNAERQRSAEDEERRAEAAARADLERLKREQYAQANEKQHYRSEALKVMGRGRQASQEEALLAATQKKGEELTPEERANVLRFTNMRFDMQALAGAGMSNIQDFAPRVNSLIARGGSDAPVSMPKVEELQYQSVSQLKRLNDAATRLLYAIEKGGLIF